MDLSATIIPKSDQINAEDLLTGPITVTVDHVVVKKGQDQPVDIHLIETPGRCYRPSKTMRRVLVKVWGNDSDKWPPSARMTLYRDPDVKWGGEKVGGVKISHLSHIDKPLTLVLTETKGKRVPHTVKPLTDAPASQPTTPQITPEAVANSTDIDQLREWQQQEPRAHDAIEARINELTTDGEPA